MSDVLRCCPFAVLIQIITLPYQIRDILKTYIKNYIKGYLLFPDISQSLVAIEPWIAKYPEYLTNVYKRMHALIQGTHGYNTFLKRYITLILKIYINQNSKTK